MFLVLSGISNHLSDSPEISERICRSATAGKRKFCICTNSPVNLAKKPTQVGQNCIILFLNGFWQEMRSTSQDKKSTLICSVLVPQICLKGTVLPKMTKFSIFFCFQLLKNPAPTVFELQGSYWYQKKRNETLYRSVEIFFLFSDFQKTYDFRKLKIFMKNFFISF